MLACVCQPTDPGIFRRSPIPLGAPPLKFTHKGAIPKPGRTLRIPVITDEPRHKVVPVDSNNSSSSADSNNSAGNSGGDIDKQKIKKRKYLNDSDKKRNHHHHHQQRELVKKFNSNASVNKCAVESAPATTVIRNSKAEEHGRKEEEKKLVGVVKGTDRAEREEITVDATESPGADLKSGDKKRIRKLNDYEKLPEGVQLTLSELREMACRQQSQIDSQHQLLAAKEQRLRYLKEQEARQQRVQAESERLRRLRDRVDAQELKLRKLRAIRGQVDHQKQNNLSLTSDLDSIRALFNEKEKELSLAVAKVEELTRQLEELRRGRSARDQPPASALELDKLRRELMYRNKLNEQQNQRLNQQREALTARQEEMSAIDKRISELQERLHRKRLLNQQLANQISATSHKAAYHQLVRLTGANEQNSQVYPRKPQHPVNHPSTGLSRTNIAAVEPYNHVPLQSGQQQTRNPAHITNPENPTYHPVYQQQGHIKNDIDHHQDNQELSNNNNNNNNNNKVTTMYGTKQEETDNILKDFAVSKSDPKYQTLPYNTKFTVNIVPCRGNGGKTSDTNDNGVVNGGDLKDFEANNHISSHINANMQSHTVHSAPLSVVNKNIATPLNQNDLISRKSAETAKDQHADTRTTQNGIKISDNGPISSMNNNAVPPYQKPISSVAPTSVHNSGKISNIYQTASIKVQPVEPQTVVSAHKQLNPTQPSVSASQSLALSPPQSTSTPLSTPETSLDKTKPALPPKPAIKPPPRQTQAFADESSQPPPVPSSEPPSDDKLLPKPQSHIISKPLPQTGAINQNSPAANQRNYALHLSNSQSLSAGSNSQTANTPNYNTDNMPIIKAKPLTIKKQPMSEQPKLRSLSSYSKQNGLISRRIEMPPTFHFIESISDKSSENESSSETSKDKNSDETDKASLEESDLKDRELKDTKTIIEGVVRRCKKGNLKQNGKANLSRRVSFDPLALLLDASLEGELELVKKTATQVPNPSAANDEGITALHNAICAGHLEIVKFLVEFGCDVNAQDSDGWTPLHCAASCNNVAMVKFLVEHGACIFATTLSDHETAAEKCEEDEEGFDGCSEYLYSVQEKLGILSGGVVYAVFDYTAQQQDELTFIAGQQLTVLRKGDENEREWWWSRLGDKEGYIPRNLLGLYPRVTKSED